MAVYKISAFIARACLGVKISAFGNFRNISTYRTLLVNAGFECRTFARLSQSLDVCIKCKVKYETR